MKFLLILTGILGVTSCASVKPGEPQSSFRSLDPELVTIAIVGINDFHGSLLPRVRKLPDGREVQSGGASVLFSMIQRLQTEMGGNVLLVDAGDEWQGTLESNTSRGATVVEFFNRLGVRVAAIGNHEFDFGLDELKNRAQEAKYPYVASNIREKKNHRRIAWKNVYPSRIFEVGGFKFGVIGVSTQQTPSTTRYESVKHLDFVDPVPEVRDESNRLRKEGANAVLVTAHAGTECENHETLRTWGIWNRSSRMGSCSAEGEISKLAAGLGSDLLDGIVSGHTHQPIHHFISEIPVVQGEAYNQYFNIIYLTLDRRSRKVIPALTQIEGLIPICEKVFKGTNHCDVKRLAPGDSPAMVQASFHGESITPSTEVEAWLDPIRKSTEHFRNEVLGETILPLTHPRDRESPFANLIADVLREKGHADFALVNSGGIRTSLDAGPITYDGIFRALPFDNLLRVVELKGSDVKLLYRIATSGAHGAIGLSGLSLKVRALDLPAEKTDLDLNGTLDSWESNRLVEIRTAAGEVIDDDKRYRVATFDFLINGGDDLSWFMKRVREKDVNRSMSGYCRDLVSDHIRKQKKINTPDQPLMDPKHPRIEWVR